MDIVAKVKNSERYWVVYRILSALSCLIGSHLEVENNFLKLTATDLEVGITPLW